MRLSEIFIFIMFVSFGIASAKSLPTPLQSSGYARLTTQGEMMEYLRRLDQDSKYVTMSVIGKSVGGKEIPALFFTVDKEFGAQRGEKPVVFIFCQQHGNEPSGKEAALVLAGILADEGRKGVLSKLDLILVPMVNPDGADLGERRNADNMDLNRNYVILSEPEAQAIHNLFLEWMPEVTLDVHEYTAVSKQWVENGFIKDPEEMLGGVTNLNIDKRIRDFSREVLIPVVGEKVKAAGFSFHRYVVGSPFENERMRYSTTAVNDGRQSMGIYNTFSFVLEGKKYRDLLDNIERRTAGQVAAMSAFLKTAAENLETIISTVQSTRKKLLKAPAGDDVWSYIQMDYYPDSTDNTIKFPVFDLYEWKSVEKTLDNFHSIVKVKRSVRKPYAYVFSSEEDRLAELLKRSGVQFYRLRGKSDLELEIYRLKHISTRIEEEMEVPEVDFEVLNEVRRLKGGSYIVPLAQPAGNLLPLILEPHSSQSIVTESNGRKYHFGDYLKEGTEYPVYRMMKKVELGLEPVKD